MQPQAPSKSKEMYDIVVDYSGYSTLAGLIYIFMPDQTLVGKVRPCRVCEVKTQFLGQNLLMSVFSSGYSI
jgi:hypothetical protein